MIIELLIIDIEPLPIPIRINAAYIIGSDGSMAISIHDNGIRKDIVTIEAFLPILSARNGKIKLAIRFPTAKADNSPPAAE